MMSYLQLLEDRLWPTVPMRDRAWENSGGTGEPCGISHGTHNLMLVFAAKVKQYSFHEQANTLQQVF